MTENTIQWYPMENAPEGEFIDIWAKQWVDSKDTFFYIRYPDCRKREAYHGDVYNPHYEGLPRGWYPVSWMYPPKGEEE